MILSRGIIIFRIAIASIAWIISVVLLVAFHSSSYSFGGEELTLKQLHILSLLSNNVSEKTPAQYLLVNTCYDRELVELYDDYGFRKGNIDITSRKSLVSFLDSIKGGDYKAIAFDILLDLSSDSETDSLLYNRLNNTPRLYAVSSPNSSINEHIDSDKIAQSSYSINFNEGNFVKYIYKYDEFPYQSLALKIGEAIYGKQEAKSRNAAILPIYYRINQQYSEYGDANWYNLGEDLLNAMSAEELRQLCGDKIIIVGDYEDRDVHDTYVGSLSGPVIIMNAIESYGKGVCDYGYVSLTMIVLVLGFMCFYIAFGDNVFFEKYYSRKWVKMLIGVMSISSLLLIIQIFEFYFSDHFHDFAGVAIWLSIYYWVCREFNSKYPIK